MDSLLLNREELDYIESNPIFTLWLFGNVDENELNDYEKQIIFARQLYYDLIVSDDVMLELLKQVNIDNIDDFLNNDYYIKLSSHMMNRRPDIIRTKLMLMKKRQNIEKRLKLK